MRRVTATSWKHGCEGTATGQYGATRHTKPALSTAPSFSARAQHQQERVHPEREGPRLATAASEGDVIYARLALMTSTAAKRCGQRCGQRRTRPSARNQLGPWNNPAISVPTATAPNRLPTRFCKLQADIPSGLVASRDHQG